MKDKLPSPYDGVRADKVIAALLALALVVGVLLWLYFPIIPRGIVGWVLLFVIGIPTWFLLEWFGGRVLGSNAFSRMGRSARIASAVPILILLLIVAACAIRFGQRAIAGS